MDSRNFPLMHPWIEKLPFAASMDSRNFPLLHPWIAEISLSCINQWIAETSLCKFIKPYQYYTHNFSPSLSHIICYCIVSNDLKQIFLNAKKHFVGLLRHPRSNFSYVNCYKSYRHSINLGIHKLTRLF